PELDAGGLPELPPLAPERARFRLFDAVATLLAAAALERPLLLVLDDLHVADLPTATLLEFLVRRLRRSRIAVLGAYRPTDARRAPVGEALARAARELVTLALPPLDRQAV